VLAVVGVQVEIVADGHHGPLPVLRLFYGVIWLKDTFLLIFFFFFFGMVITIIAQLVKALTVFKRVDTTIIVRKTSIYSTVSVVMVLFKLAIHCHILCWKQFSRKSGYDLLGLVSSHRSELRVP